MSLSKMFTSTLLGAAFTTLLASAVIAHPQESAPEESSVTEMTLADLNPGDTYRLAFVTSTETTANSNDIDFYNNFVNTLGFDATGIIGWTAIVSTQTIDARDNTNTTASYGVMPIFSIDGLTLITDGPLWSSDLDNAINLTELGTTIDNDYVWTGTLWTGLAKLNRWLGSDDKVMAGKTKSDYANDEGKWVEKKDKDVEKHDEYEMNRLYAISGVITVGTVGGATEIPGPSTPVPEPGMLAIFGLGLVGLGFARGKKKTA
jgi:hypothetical protein